jgi:hypothetical protein
MFKNTSAGNQIATITASTAGVYSDTTNTDVLAATDNFNCHVITGTTGTSIIFSFMAMWTTLGGITIPQTVFIDWEEA